MKLVKLLFAADLFALCFVITNSCSQTPAPAGSSAPEIFIASTPCNEISKSMFEIPAGMQCELMKWKLTLDRDPKTSVPSAFNLVCVYGLPKQGTRDFMEGAKTIELTGKWTIDKGTRESTESIIYTLKADNSSISLSFLKPDQNLLHLLDRDKRLMIGNGAWSYTLNRINPVTTTSAKISPQTTTGPLITSDSATIGIFDGRTACNSILGELHGISASGCQRTKWRLTLFQDTKTHKPTTFQLKSIFVGKGDSSYTNTGKWIVTKGTQTDPDAVVYQLELDPGKPQRTLAFLRADDNILFFLDKEKSLMVGDGESSYTLNKIK